MGRVHEIGIGTDTRPFEDGIRRGVIKPTEEAEDALKRLGDAGGDAGADGARGLDRLEDALKDAQRQSEKTERSVEDIGGAGGKSFGKFNGAAQEVTQEIGANLSEAVSSVRGNLADLGQVGQDTLGGLAGTLAGAGPAGIVGAAALAAGAVGLGLVTAQLQTQQEEADLLKERLSEAYRSAAEAGRSYIDTATIIKDTQDLMYNPDRAAEYSRVLDTQKQTGLDLNTIYKANAGDLEAIRIVQSRVTELVDEQVEKLSKSGGGNISRELQDVEDHWRAVGSAADESDEKAKDAAKATSALLMQAARDAGTATEEVDEFGNRLLTLPTGQQILISADTGLATDKVDTFKEDVDGIEDTITTKVLFDDTGARTTLANLRKDAEKGLTVPVTGLITGRTWE